MCIKTIGVLSSVFAWLNQKYKESMTVRYVAEEIAISYWDLYGLLEKDLKKRTPRFQHECPREWSLHYQKKGKGTVWGTQEEKMVSSISHMFSLKQWCDEQFKCPLSY